MRSDPSQLLLRMPTVCKLHHVAAQLMDSAPPTLEQQLLDQRKLLQEAHILVDELAERVRLLPDRLT